MGIVFRQSIKSTIVIAAGAILGGIINLYYPFVLSKAELGYARFFILQAAVFHLLTMLGTGSTIMNFSPRYEAGSEQRKVLLSIGAITPIIITALLSIPYFIFREQIIGLFKPGDQAVAIKYYSIAPLMVFLWSYMTAFECYLISQSKVAILSFVREIVLRLMNIGLIVLLALKMLSFSGLMYGLTVSYLISVLILFHFSKKTSDFGLSFRFGEFKKADYKEILDYSIYHMFMTITLNLLGYVDAMLLGTLAPEGFTSLATYTIAVFFATLMYIPYRAMSNASIPTLNRVYISGNMEELRELFKRSSLNILITATAMFALIASNLNNAVAILPESYSELKVLVIILITGKMLDMSTGLNSELTSVSKYYKFNFRSSIFLVLMLIGLCYAFIPQYGARGAAWATTAALGLFNLTKTIFLWKKMGIQPFSGKSLVVLFCGLVAFLPGFYLPYLYHPVIDTVIRSLVVAGCYLGMLIWLKPSADLNTYLQSIRENKRLF